MVIYDSVKECRRFNCGAGGAYDAGMNGSRGIERARQSLKSALNVKVRTGTFREGKRKLPLQNKHSTGWDFCPYLVGLVAKEVEQGNRSHEACKLLGGRLWKNIEVSYGKSGGVK